MIPLDHHSNLLHKRHFFNDSIEEIQPSIYMYIFMMDWTTPVPEVCAQNFCPDEMPWPQHQH